MYFSGAIWLPRIRFRAQRADFPLRHQVSPRQVRIGQTNQGNTCATLLLATNENRTRARRRQYFSASLKKRTNGIHDDVSTKQEKRDEEYGAESLLGNALPQRLSADHSHDGRHNRAG